MLWTQLKMALVKPVSREKAKRAEAWKKSSKKPVKQKKLVKGIINGKVKGGFYC